MLFRHSMMVDLTEKNEPNTNEQAGAYGHGFAVNLIYPLNYSEQPTTI